MKTYRLPVFLAIAAGILLTAPSGWTSGNDVPKAELPVLTTSAGQSPDITTLNIICEEAGIPYDYCDVPTAEIIAAGVGLGGQTTQAGGGFYAEVHSDLDKHPEGTPYKTVIFAIGASLKGMGASGLTVDDEVNRLKKVVDYCKSQKIFMVAVHVGGTSKRGAPGSDNERMIDAVAPFADFLVVTKDANKDGRFTKISQDNGIPLTEIDFALGLVGVLQQTFGL